MSAIKRIVLFVQMNYDGNHVHGQISDVRDRGVDYTFQGQFRSEEGCVRMEKTACII